MAVPYTFGTATAAIPLSQLDSNFATTITLGNTAIQLGNTVTTLNNMTLANVTVSSGNVTLTNVAITTANVTTANIGTAVITGTSTLTGLTASTALALDASKNIVSVTNTGTGNNVLSASPTLTGTIAGASLSLSSLTASSAVATDASKNLVSVTNTGTGNNVLATSPTITTPTISSLTSAAATALTLQSAGTTAVTANTSQNVGVGTSTITAKLHAYATSGTTTTIGRFEAAIGSYTGTSLIAANTLSPSSTYNLFSCLADSDGDAGGPFTEFLVRGDGIVSMPAYGAGAATFSAAGVISSVSDETWKIKDGVPVDVDSMLNKLEPGYWYYNDEKKETFGTDRQLGFYAQNVNAAIGPEAAPVPEEGKPWGYYDRSVLAVTVMSLQKALATIESLTARIAALESK